MVWADALEARREEDSIAGYWAKKFFLRSVQPLARLSLC